MYFLVVMGDILDKTRGGSPLFCPLGGSDILDKTRGRQ